MKLVRPFEDSQKYHNAQAVRVRLFRQAGQYPRAILASEGFLYYASDEIVFTAVLSQPFDQMELAFPYSEMLWATPQELRLWASIILCEDSEGRRAMFYPEYDVAGYLEPANVDLRNSAIQEELRALVIKDLASPLVSKPKPFPLFGHEFNLRRQQELFRSIRGDDHLLLRGIACLIKADMLATYREFTEEATIVIFIALDSSFDMVCDLLRKSGTANPTARDAGAWLDDTFNKPIGIMDDSGKYYEAFYEQRVITMHPDSRFGSCPFAPLMVDDLFQLRRELREVFAYLVTGEHGPEFHRRLSEATVP